MYQHGFLSGLVECDSVLKMSQAAASLLYLFKAGNTDDVTDVCVLYVIGKDMKIVIGGLATNLFFEPKRPGFCSVLHPSSFQHWATGSCE